MPADRVRWAEARGQERSSVGTKRHRGDRVACRVGIESEVGTLRQRDDRAGAIIVRCAGAGRVTSRCGHNVVDGDSQVLPNSFVDRVEERLVFLDRPAKCRSKLVLLKRRDGAPAPRSKKSLASSAELRKYSKTSPWNWFVPPLLTATIWLPMANPYSAWKVPVTILYSLMPSKPRALPESPATGLRPVLRLQDGPVQREIIGSHRRSVHAKAGARTWLRWFLSWLTPGLIQGQVNIVPAIQRQLRHAAAR